jgi:hypothetical protein
MAKRPAKVAEAKPTRREQEFQLRERLAKIDGTARVFHSFFKYGALVAVAYFSFLSVETLAGKTTIANVLLDLRTSLAYVVGAGGLAYGALQRKLRRDTIQREHGRLKEYEQKLDPGRSSSQLLPSGATRPEDEP